MASGISSLYTLAAVTTVAGSIGQIVSQDIDTGIEEILEGASGQPDSQFAAILEQKPMLSFTTTAVATALGVCGLNAYAVTGNIDFYFQKIAQGGVRATGASHLRLRATNGMIVPKTISAQQGDKTGAKISYTFHAISSNGTTAPLAITNSIALPTITPVSELFTVGPVALTPGGGSSTALSSIQQMTLDFGMNAEALGADGQAYPTFAGVITRRPNIALNGLDLSKLSTFGVGGTPLDAFVVYLRQIAAGGTRVADSTAAHIALSGTAGMFRPKSARAQDKAHAEGEWNISPVWDGTNDVIQISTTSTITE